MIEAGVHGEGIGEAQTTVGQRRVGILHMNGIAAGAAKNIHHLHPILSCLIHHNGIGRGSGGPEVGGVAIACIYCIRTKAVSDGGVGAEINGWGVFVH